MRALTLMLLIPVAGCALKSNLEPAEPLDALDASETAQLCRFTTDVLQGVDPSCTEGRAALTGFDDCVADPAWDECPTPVEETADIGSWEACVNRLTEDGCGAGSGACWHFRCR